MANNYAVVRTDNMHGTDVRADLASVKYMVSDTPTEIENGNVLKVSGTLLPGEREIFEAVTPAANDALDDIVLIATPEVMYDHYDLTKFINPADVPARGYHLRKGDIFSVTAEALDVSVSGKTEPEVGNIVELQADTKLKVVASATNGSTTVGKVIAVDVVGKLTYYAIQVL